MTYRNRSRLVATIALGAFMGSAAAVAAVYWLDLVGVRDRSVVAALAAGAGAWMLSRFWLSWRGRVQTDPDGVEVVDERGAVRVPWEEIEGFRVVGSEREVAQVVADRVGAEPLRLRPIEGHGWTPRAGRRSAERDVAALNEELARRR